MIELSFQRANMDIVNDFIPQLEGLGTALLCVRQNNSEPKPRPGGRKGDSSPEDMNREL